MGTIFIILGALIFCAHLFSALFSRRRIPDVLFLVAIGILIGPVLGLVTTAQIGRWGSILSYVTLVFILVDSGVDIKINDIRRYWTGVVQVTLYSFLLSMAAAAITSHYVVCLDWRLSLLVGSMVAGTGSSIVIPMVNQMKVSDKTRTVLVLESAISAVLCIVVALAIVEGIQMGQISFLSILGKVLASFTMALIVGVVGGMLWSSLLQRVRKLNNSMFLTPAFMFVIYGITEALGFSGAIASLSFGVVLGNANYFELRLLRKMRGSHRRMLPMEDNEKSFFKEIVFVLKTFFFVYIGISIPFTDHAALLYGLAIAAAIYVVRFVLVTIVGHKNTKTDRLAVSMLIPKGLVSAVLASIPRQVNALTGWEVIPHAERIECLVYSTIFFSIVICSLLVLLTRKKLLDTTITSKTEK
ncbi:MAG: cation:proton antiporter [Bacteroidales bacterium]|nr:cation:proton antiporter [Bacteroidales bacterium]